MAATHGTDAFDFSGMTDDELYDVAMQALREHPEVDEGWIEVSVAEGAVTLAGRVGSDAEASMAEQVLTGSLGLTVVNDLVVDALHRGEAPEAADDAAPDEGNGAQSDTAAHLTEDLDAQMYGTRDLGTAIEEGATYIPPDRPRGDGYGSRERH
jgi:hypothetical protein